MDGRQKKKPKN